MTYPIAANGALYDPAQAEEYIAMLFRHVDWQPGQGISLLGIGEKGTDREGVFKDRQFVAPGSLFVVHSHLKRWAQWHAAGFIVPAVLTAAAQEKGDVTLDKIAALTAIVLDIDSGDVNAKHAYVSERLGKPSMVVASGGKTEAGKRKAHLYWLLSEPSDEVERIAALRKLLASKVGGDQSFGRATQVIRVPGSVHAKNGKASVCSILDRCAADYDLEDLADIIEGMQPMPGVEPLQKLQELPMSGSFMDFTPRQDTAVAALHRDIAAGGDELTRWGEFSKIAGFHIAELRAGRITVEEAASKTQGWMLTHMDPPWPEARFRQEFLGLYNKDLANHGPIPQTAIAVAQAAGAIEPTPAAWPIGSMIPPRPWLFGHWLQRGIVTAVIAPGGVGKSSLVAAMTLSMASGRELLGKTVYGGPLRPWVWNLEDSGDNLARARIAASVYHRIGEADCGGRIYVDSGPDGATLCTAVEDRAGFTLIVTVFDNIVAALIRLKIDALFIDPFVSSHAINENDNNRVDAVVKAWARVAKAANCAIVLVHHSVKMKGEQVTADSSRGAGALNNAARMTLVLNRMTPDQAMAWQIPQKDVSRYFSVIDDKHNMTAPEAADWFKLESQTLGNGNETYEADSIGVVTQWQPPRAMDGVDATHLFRVQQVLHAGPDPYWRSIKNMTPQWAGSVVANVLGLPDDEPAARKRLDTMLATWINSGALAVVTKKNGNSKNTPAVVVGQWVGDPNEPATN